MSQPERYVIGSGAAIEFESDGTMRVSVNPIAFDAHGNVIARPNSAQALAFVRWIVDRVDVDDLDGWLKEKAEALRAGKAAARNCDLCGRAEGEPQGGES